ncbi:response regulator transcription factor [Anaeroselena agilis]|uniref:Response regulator transcription factor n=1 Tax=Anaeroselena agilis TaxID=3063788 RepID=A0ABU3NS57_9FIRM|nr:response regulator transcription factor [Selenomonadales bacterium 4137-cl]
MSYQTVFIVDDDIKITKLLKSYFDKEGFITYLAHDGASAVQSIKDKNPDIVILDLMLPGMDGWEICRKLRRESDVPIIMLTARDEETDRVIGLEMGADDYVTKPFSPREVVARTKAILRRTQKTAAKSDPIRVGELLIDAERHLVKKGNNELDLTPTEFKILELLATNAGRVLTRLQIVERVQGYSFEGYERTVDAHMKNLRRKIEDNPKEPRHIVTIYGVGYRFVVGGDGE